MFCRDEPHGVVQVTGWRVTELLNIRRSLQESGYRAVRTPTRVMMVLRIKWEGIKSKHLLLLLAFPAHAQSTQPRMGLEPTVF